jgi:EAL domain-containing protein (putative c-di-GMP-specific phosphodiesterase class I)
VELLGALRRIGVRLAIDDFGAGYSSLNYLKRFPFSRLKIDQSFVSNLVSDANDAAIVAAIIALGRSLRMEVLAEGIETVEQLEIVRRLGCRQGQGYLFARPLDAAATEALLLQVRAGRGLVMALLTDTEPSSRNP